MSVEKLKEIAEEAWEGCDGCTEEDKHFWTNGFASGYARANGDLADFLKWLGDNKWHRYKDGKWFTTTELPYMDAQPRKFYKEGQVVRIYEESTKK